MIHKIHWTSRKIARAIARIELHVYRRQQELEPFRLAVLPGPEADPPVGIGVGDAEWEIVAPHSYWGGWGQDFVLRTTFTIPDAWPSDPAVALYLPLGEAGDFSHPEALAYIDGRSYAACDRHHQEILLPDRCRDGDRHTLALHGWTGLGGWLEDDDLDTKLYMRPCAVVQIDQPTRDFIATARVTLGTADQLPENDPAQGLLYNALNEAFQILDAREPIGEAFYVSVSAAHEILREGIAKAGQPLGVQLVASGHAHIDVAWLWSLAQTRRKAGRTFHNVLRLMEQFPDYHFTQSQPQLYEYIRQDYPELLEAIKDRAAEGRWEIIGGMWVEADCNLSGSEALARQFLLGRSFFREHFGPDAESPVLWLPDVFGYAWNLPQLIKEAGLEYFFTIKISWNQYNRMPYDSFWWQGLDGTKVLTHFSPTQDEWSLNSKETRRPTTYNADASPLQILSTWTNLQQKETQQDLLMAFGFGDGGGGPTREMLENIRELRAFPSAPQVSSGRAGDFFRQLDTAAGEKLPTWNGELYLEYHRGTYTTQAANKRGNRKSEILLHDAEFLAGWAALATGYEYPHDELTEAWRLLCLNQFHDILPGSSIAKVYEDSARDYAAIAEIGEHIRESALASLAQHLPREAQVVAVNPTSFGGKKIALFAEHLGQGQTLSDLASGDLLITQPVEEGTLVELPHMDGYGMNSLGIVAVSGALPESSLQAKQVDERYMLENEWLQVVLDERGDIVSILDKPAGRQVLADGRRGNEFQAFEDRPMDWDAWDIEIYYEDKQWTAAAAHSIRIIEGGPLRAGVEVRRRLLNSEIVQRIFLYRDQRRIDFDTIIDWRERHILLKVAFPVNVLSPVATYDIQWGNVQRPTHRNTSWDWARFETCAHKWADLSEGDYGVSLLNDCKYGHDIHDNVIRLTLLRSPTAPDPQADQGEHRFTYSLLPHAGDWRSGTAQAAYALNDPPIVRQTGGGLGDQAASTLLSVNKSHVIIETIKQAEDGLGLIVRLYENERSRGMVTLDVGMPLTRAFRCNLLEENQELLEVKQDKVLVNIEPYQIITLRLVF